ncbi:hypothetical protein D3C77_435020 [compost metagenome]
MGRLDFRAQGLQRLGIVDVQLAPGEAGGLQGCHIVGFTRCGPDLIAGMFETVCKCAADAAGTTGDEDDGHERRPDSRK